MFPLKAFVFLLFAFTRLHSSDKFLSPKPPTSEATFSSNLIEATSPSTVLRAKGLESDITNPNVRISNENQPKEKHTIARVEAEIPPHSFRRLQTDWTLPQYYLTSDAITVGSLLYFFNRSPTGLMLSEFDSVATKWTRLDELQYMTDAQGWDVAMRYMTIRLTVIGSDLYIFGRGENATCLVKYDTLKKNATELREFAFLTDNDGFTDLLLYSTVRMAAIGAKLYILARGTAEINLAAYDSLINEWTLLPSLNLTVFPSDIDWSKPGYYSTLRLVTNEDDLWLIIRGPLGLYFISFDTVLSQWNDLIHVGEYKDQNGWNNPTYYLTLTTLTINGMIFAIERGGSGIYIVYFDIKTQKGTWPGAIAPICGDSGGWNIERNYRTVQSTLCGGKSVTAARANSVVVGARYNWPNDWDVLPQMKGFENSIGWDSPEAYLSWKQVCIGNTVYIVGRKDSSLTIVSQDVLTGSWDTEAPLFYTCDNTCAICSAANSNSCFQCKKFGVFVSTPPSQCKCGPGSFADPDDSNCSACSLGCLSCSSLSVCSECEQSWYQIGSKCVMECPEHYRVQQTRCAVQVTMSVNINNSLEVTFLEAVTKQLQSGDVSATVRNLSGITYPVSVSTTAVIDYQKYVLTLTYLSAKPLGSSVIEISFVNPGKFKDADGNGIYSGALTQTLHLYNIEKKRLATNSKTQLTFQ